MLHAICLGNQCMVPVSLQYHIGCAKESVENRIEHPGICQDFAAILLTVTLGGSLLVVCQA